MSTSHSYINRNKLLNNASSVTDAFFAADLAPQTFCNPKSITPFNRVDLIISTTLTELINQGNYHLSR